MTTNSWKYMSSKKCMIVKFCVEYNGEPLCKKLICFAWWHRCWWRWWETKCVDDNLKMLVTVLAIIFLVKKFLVTNILFVFNLASCTNIENMSPTLKFCHQHPKITLWWWLYDGDSYRIGWIPRDFPNSRRHVLDVICWYFMM